ncbi:MAG: proline--tRNA ligase [bacterium]|nr:proline--tRNA ligase [bacterium]
MLRSRYFVPTLKESPADAQVVSHQLMVRAGLVRQLVAGVYSFLPLGLKALQKAINIVREEMDGIGAQEFFLPSLNPIEIWDETGRNAAFGDDMMRVKDRKGREYALAPTHEEIICHLARSEVRSWRDMPQIWYQIQTKYRDEPRPRSGLLRVRQFLMKDAYSLDIDQDGLDLSYSKHRVAYQRIFERCGLNYFIVGASSGLMGGTGSEEFMIESDAGEDRIARCEATGYAANVEIATSIPHPITDEESVSTPYELVTPEQRTIDEVTALLGVPAYRMVKTLVYITGSDKLVVALLRGDDELVEAKLMAAVGEQIFQAPPNAIPEHFNGADVGFLGPQGVQLPIYADHRLLNGRNLISGANKNGYHLGGLDTGRDFKPTSFVDLRAVKEGEGSPDGGGPLTVVSAIELGHIFKLGTKYSHAMGATYLDEHGKEKDIIMGSYGIGVGRILVGAIEQDHDENGIVWPRSLTPLKATIVPVNVAKKELWEVAEKLHDDCKAIGMELLLDDRDARAGVKFKDADLLGFPYTIVVGDKSVAEGLFEVKDRRTGERSMTTRAALLELLQSV